MREIESLFAHMAWADARVLDALRDADRDAGPTDTPVPALLAHLVAAEAVWLARLRGEDATPLQVWPTLDLEGVATLAERTHSAYADYLMSLGPRGLERRVVYRNTKGVEYRTRVRDILTHVALHGSYHRGQIASALREAGHEPVSTDYITYVRETDAEGGRSRRVW